MTERVYPSAKPAVNGGGVAPPPVAVNGAAANAPAFPANKAQLYNSSRPAYRPQPPPRRSRKRCCCKCCLWSTVCILIVILLAGIAGVVFYVIYHPHLPSFSPTSLQLSQFNLTDTTITSAFNFTLTARNRNSKITYFYDPIDLKIISQDISIGAGSFPAFTHQTKNITVLKTVVSSSRSPIPADADLTKLKSSVRSKNLPLEIQLDTKVKAKIGSVKTKKFQIRVQCTGIKITLPSGNTTATASTSKVKCDVDPRFKILKWTV